MSTSDADHRPSAGAPVEPIAAQPFTPARSSTRSWRQLLRPLPLLVGAGLLLCLALAVFVFTARSVLLFVSPGEAQLQLSGAFHLALGPRYLLWPGDYRLQIAAPGYYPVDQTLQIGRAQHQRYDFSLQRTPGLLRLQLPSEQGLQLFVDGERVAAQSPQPPYQFAISAGEHQLLVLVDRYLPYETTLTIAGSGELQTLEPPLQAAWADYQFDSDPGGAAVYVDGELIGHTPLRYPLLQGEHLLEMLLPGYEAWQQNLAVVAGAHRQWPTVVLAPQRAWLQLDSRPADVNVTLNEEFLGATPLQVDLRPDQDYQLTLFKAGYETLRRTLRLDSGERRALVLEMTPQYGRVTLRVEPRDAELYVDGVSVGRANQTLQLPAYRHQLEIKRENYAPQQLQVTPRPGYEQSLQLRLLTLAESRWAAVKAQINTGLGQPLRLIKGGSFTMGASRREPGRRANELLRAVEVSRAYYLGTREVSNAEYRQFDPEHSSGQLEGHSLNGDQQPVVGISWSQAARFCNWLSARDGLPPFYRIEQGAVIAMDYQSNGYRLPTEAEWAWAARRQGGKFPWGDTMPPPPRQGNYADGSAAALLGRAIPGYVDDNIVSAAIASYAADKYGFYDLGGNVAEWINDYYGSLSPTVAGVERDPHGPESGEFHVVRGASWQHSTVTELRWSYRDYAREARSDLGFRLARYVE